MLIISPFSHLMKPTKGNTAKSSINPNPIFHVSLKCVARKEGRRDRSNSTVILTKLLPPYPKCHITRLSTNQSWPNPIQSHDTASDFYLFPSDDTWIAWNGNSLSSSTWRNHFSESSNKFFLLSYTYCNSPVVLSVKSQNFFFIDCTTLNLVLRQCLC